MYTKRTYFLPVSSLIPDSVLDSSRMYPLRGCGVSLKVAALTTVFVTLGFTRLWEELYRSRPAWGV